jgi:hypothetical protein
MWQDKKVVKLSPDDNMHMEGFALSVFAKADKQDRAGRADVNTAKTFYAASIFFEVLLQFGELQPDVSGLISVLHGSEVLHGVCSLCACFWILQLGELQILLPIFVLQHKPHITPWLWFSFSASVCLAWY